MYNQEVVKKLISQINGLYNSCKVLYCRGEYHLTPEEVSTILLESLKIKYPEFITELQKVMSEIYDEQEKWIRVKFDSINWKIRRSKDKAEAQSFYVQQMDRHEECPTKANAINQLKYLYKTKVALDEADTPKLTYYTLEEVIITKFKQLIDFKFSTWLQMQKHNVEEPSFLTMAMYIKLKILFCEERDRTQNLMETVNYSQE
jgi:hypothetical protein